MSIYVRRRNFGDTLKRNSRHTNVIKHPVWETLQKYLEFQSEQTQVGIQRNPSLIGFKVYWKNFVRKVFGDKGQNSKITKLEIYYGY